MSTDHYTQLHNLAFRGGINTRYVGIFGFIASHREGWELTEASVGTALDVGRDFVRSALHALEESYCLIRCRRRDSDGTLRGAVWFVTDLALQLRQLGITDETVLRDRVQAAYKHWLTEARPETENPPLALTCGNTETESHLPSSEPKSGFPTLANPTLGKPTHKKTKTQEDLGSRRPSKNSSSPSVDLSPSRASSEQGEEEQPPAKENPAPVPSAEAVALVKALPAIHGDRPGGQLAVQISERLAAGWSTEALRRELIRDLGTARGTGVYHARLASLPDVPVMSVPTPRPEPVTTKTVVDHTKRAVRQCEHGRVAVNCPKCRDTALKAIETAPETVSEPQTAESRDSAMDPRLSKLLSAVAATSARR